MMRLGCCSAAATRDTQCGCWTFHFLCEVFLFSLWGEDFYFVGWSALWVAVAMRARLEGEGSSAAVESR